MDADITRGRAPSPLSHLRGAGPKRKSGLWWAHEIKQIIGVLIMLCGVVCFWLESADRSQADWKIDALGILLVLFGLWVGKFNFRKDKDGSAM
jgi:hypothetical protein